MGKKFGWKIKQRSCTSMLIACGFLFALFMLRIILKNAGAQETTIAFVYGGIALCAALIALIGYALRKNR